MSLKEKACGKLNLSLDVLGKLDSGYHEMLMVMQSVSLCDDISVKVSPGSGNITVRTNRSYLPTDENNLGYAAAKLFIDTYGIAGRDVDIDIVKRVPVCAGMGGGSSDAAAVLRGLNRAFSTKIGSSELTLLSAKLGSDVPYCVCGGTVLASGTGTELKQIAKLPRCSFVIIKPRFSVSTPKLFAAIDGVKLRAHPDTEGLVAALAAGNIVDAARRCYNVFEEVLPPREHEKVELAKDKLLSCGAINACMTGTGSVVFGIFTDDDLAKNAHRQLRNEYAECFFAVPSAKIDF